MVMLWLGVIYVDAIPFLNDSQTDTYELIQKPIILRKIL